MFLVKKWDEMEIRGRVNRKKAALFFLLLLCLGLFGNLTPQANASLSGTNFYEEVTALPFHPRVVDVDSKGDIFILSYDQDVWLSTNNGATWAKVFDDGIDWSDASAVVKRDLLTLFIDNNGYVFVNIARTKELGIWDLYRSVDRGSSWSVVIEKTGRSWHMDEASDGTLWFHTYTGPGWATIHKSDDHGATWSVFYNFTMVSEDLRTVAVNDYDDNEIWAATSRRVIYWNGSSWITVHYDTRSQSYTSSIWFDQTYVYLGAEYLGGKKTNWRYPHAPKPNLIADWSNYDYYWDADKLTYVADEHSFHGLRISDIMLFGIRSQLWGSWDGTRWVKIVDLGNATASDIASISQRRPIYFVDKKVGKLYRLSVSKEDLVQLYYSEFLKYRGNRVNQENYVAECRITNGTNDIDLTNVALDNIQASIKGLSRRNYFGNSGFEYGNTTGWTFSGTGAYSVSTDRYEGTFALGIEKNQTDAWNLAIWQSYTPAPRGEILTLSAWVKANVTLTSKVRIGLRNQTSGTWAYYPGSAKGVRDFNVTTSWTRVKLHFAVNCPDVNLRAEFWALKGETYELLVDGLQLEKREVEIVRQELNMNTESIEHVQYQPSPYFADTLDTLNPSVTINGQTVSHSGTLANGSESSPTTLTGILSGPIQVDANIQGSRQAILKITGTRVLYEDSIILKGRTSGVYYGRYYGTFSPTTTTSDLIAVTNLQANITALTYASNKLTLTIDSPSGTTSTTKIYCGDKGEPTSVQNATSWSYNNTSKILTTTAVHSSPINITVKWRFPGDVIDDVAIIDLEVPTLAHLGDSILINVTVKNEGDYEEEVNVTVRYYGIYNSSTIGSENVTLIQGQNKTASFTWSTTGLMPGGYTIEANASIPYAPRDGDDDLGDNLGSKSVLLRTHDVKVTSITAPSHGYRNSSMPINVVVRNEGHYREAVNVTLQYDTVLIGFNDTIELSMGSNITVSFTWYTTSLTLGNYNLTANATVLPSGTNAAGIDDDPGDNTLDDVTVFITIPCDANGDGTVDDSDLSEFDEAYGHELGDSNWTTYAYCDFNGDNKVDASDLFDLSKNYGKKWKFAGDVNGDGVVDASDLFDLSKAYGSKSGDLNWNVDCDFNKDNKTDALDLFDLSKNYGKNV